MADESSSSSSTNGSPPKLLDVRHQIIKDALGNSGTYTGTINVATNLPHGTGGMIYTINATNDHDENDNNIPTTLPTTLVESHNGSWEEGYWQGHGTQKLNNGDSFIGEFDKSLRIFGEYKWKEEEQRQTSQHIVIRKQRVYQGGFHENGRPHGHGKYTWTTLKIEDNANEQKSVSSYVGMFENGQRQGHGVYTSSALTYTGDWMLGKYHGYGVLKVPAKKSTYRGQFHFGKKDGKGEEVLDDGTIIHEGLWREDRPFAQEEQTSYDDDDDDNEKSKKSTSQALSTIFQTPTEIVDGEGVQGLYKGIVEEALPSGVGTITYEFNHHPTGVVQYEGFFDRGIRQGYGRADFGNGDHYSGNWSNGIFEGNGEYTFADGRIYKGTWLDGLPHDTEAKFVWPNSDLFEGVYENGHRKDGRIVFADGAYYQGEFYSPDGNYGGEGRLVTLLVSYEGGFRDGAFHGRGCLKKNNGFVIFDGEWVDGKAVRDDVLISIPQDLLIIPSPPVDDDFGEFEDGPAPSQASDFLSTIQRNISPPPEGNSHPSLSSTIMGTSTKFIESIASNFSSIHVSETHGNPKPMEEQCKAVVDMAVSDAQDNPGRYVNISFL
jgi:hypothetical protein